MTALGKLIRTTTFKLTLVYLSVFALFAIFLLGYFTWNTQRLINQQITETVDAEISGLAEQFHQGGIRKLVQSVDSRSRRSASTIYLVTTFSGESIAGNISSLSPGVLENVGWSETLYRRPDESDSTEGRALVRVVQLPGGFRLLVGRDLEEERRLRAIILEAGRWLIGLVIVLGLAGGIFATRRVLKRVDAMTETTKAIMAGDLSGRLAISGTGDELDRLASHLNGMFERIELLMRGLKEVSDNIAHDFKTPLTRLRNRCEEALRHNEDEAGYRATLEATIEESETLIRTFNALLMIARAESGQARDDMVAVDASEIARGVGDLYEPLADEKGLELTVEAPSPVLVNGNRELISQALANLVDNAIKYARPESPALNGQRAQIKVSANQYGDHIELSVADHGPGIPDGDRERVVQRFVRLERSRSEPGSGLGLSLASAVAHLHAGELQLVDNGPGLKATLTLPRARRVTPAEGIGAPEQSPETVPVTL